MAYSLLVNVAVVRLSQIQITQWSEDNRKAVASASMHCSLLKQLRIVTIDSRVTLSLSLSLPL